jgi:UDP-N-acetylmuramoyl-tripeptide--D-alanyl-D-alanine ligase
MRAILSRILRAGERAPGFWRARSFLLAHLAAAHRRRLAGITFVGITGSAGKTTTMLLTAAVLSAAGKVRSSRRNKVDGVVDIVLATRPSDDFSVIELSAYPKGSLDRSLAMVKPGIGVITSIGTDHIRAFHSLEAIAAEKAKVIQSLSSDGVAVLNADDPLVIAMAGRAPCHVITYGEAESATVRAQNVRSTWPERLSFTAIYREERVEVRSQLCGSHWVSAALAALCVGIASGISLKEAAKAIELVEPYHHRMYPLTSSDGITFILDDWKSALWTVPSTLEFMKTAVAPRKFIIFGTLSDCRGSSERAYKHTALSALEVVDQVIFVGPMATSALSAKGPENAGKIHTFGTIKGAAEFLSSLLRQGDLVLLKGAVKGDHLGRLAHHWIEPISCWSMACRRNTRCSSCDELRADVNLKQRQQDALTANDAQVRRSKLPAELLGLKRPFRVLVGIGNPGNQYRNTPHNVGYQVIDMLAKKLGLDWTVHGNAALAFVNLEGNTVLLVKPQSYVNNLGVTLKELSEAIEFEAQDCILIQDDVSLALGKLRGRARGSDGGHKGVRSALMAFQTDEIQRFKIGVAPEAGSQAITDYVVKPFSSEATPIIESAVLSATDRILSELQKVALRAV